MATWKEYGAAQKTYNDRQTAAVESIATSCEDIKTGIGGIETDLTTMTELITKLQNSPPGEWTPEDQAVLDELQAAGEAGATKLEGVAEALTAVATKAKEVDAANPPTPPPS